jgi:pilus assembly protein CpaF
VDEVRERLAATPGDLSPHRVAEALRAAGRPVGDAMVLAVHDELRRDVLGAGPLEPLLRRPGVTDVLVNGAHEVWVDCGEGLELTAVRFPDDAAVRRLAQRLAATGGRRLDDATPHADVRLPDGTRFHAVLAPTARPGTVVSLRVPRARVFTMADLVAAGAVTDAGAELLATIVAARSAFLVTGGTGTGKTTLLAAMLSLAHPRERLVLVEDSGELRPAHPHVVGLEARPPNIEGAGEITLRTLVRQALRMRPDRLVVGEVRSPMAVSWRPSATLESSTDTLRSGQDTPQLPAGTLRCRATPAPDPGHGSARTRVHIRIFRLGVRACTRSLGRKWALVTPRCVRALRARRSGCGRPGAFMLRGSE